MADEEIRYIETSGDYYLFSEDVKVYPNISRGKKVNSSNNQNAKPDIPINPESLLYTEFNITHTGSNLGEKAKGFYLDTSDKLIKLNNIEYSVLVLGGYTFLINKTTMDTLKTQLNSTNLYACIKLNEVAIATEYLPNNSDQSTGVANTKILSSMYSEQTQNEGQDSISSTITTEILDNEIQDKYVFTGLKFVTDDPSDNSDLIWIDIKNLNAKFTISNNEIENGSITSAKLGADLINTNTATKNGITVTLNETTNDPDDYGHKLNIGISSTAVTNAQFLTNDEGEAKEAGLDITDKIGLIKFTNGEPVNVTVSSGNVNRPVYVAGDPYSGSKIMPFNFTLSQNKLVKIQNGVFSDDISTTIGNDKKLVYVNNGTITQSETKVGDTNKPVYLYQGTITPINKTTSAQKLTYFSNGEIKESSETIGGVTMPVYLDRGQIKNITGSVGTSLDDAATTYSPICLELGTFKKLSDSNNHSNINVGTNKRPVYLNDGKLKPITGQLGKDTQGIYISAEGNLTAMAGNAGGEYIPDQNNPARKAFKPVYLDSGIITENTDYSLYKSNFSFAGLTLPAYTNSATTDFTVTLDSNQFNTTTSGATSTVSLKDATTSTKGAISLKSKSTATYWNNDGKVTGADGTVCYKDTTYTGGTNISIDSSNKINLSSSLTNMTSISGASAGKLSINNVSDLTMNGTLTGYKINISNECKANYFYATSDERLKENIKDFNYDRSILDLPIKTFDFKDGAKNQIGCLAQDLQKLYPELVTEDDRGYLAIQENKLVYLLLEEVKQLKQEIAELKKKDRN